MKKQIVAAAAALALATTGILGAVTPGTFGTAKAADTAYDPSAVNYGEGLQKAFYFYEAQSSGKLPDWNRVAWRDDCMEDDIVPGGWFDAGDHFKFSLTNAWTASVLNLGYIQYGDSIKKSGNDEIYKNNLKYVLEYIKGAWEKSPDKAEGKVIGTIGKDGFDHTWWGSPELYQRKLKLQSGDGTRPYDTISCTTTVADMAAALAGGYIIFGDESYLKDAKELFEQADKTRSNDDQGVQKSYYSCSDYFDELFYAANWLYMATKDKSYLDKCESDYIPNLATENQSTERKFTWEFCWDDTLQGASLLYAINTGKQEWIDQVDHHVTYDISGYGGKKENYTDDGLLYVDQWGATRYAMNACLIAQVAADTIFKDDAAKVKTYKDWIKSQVDYVFGNNSQKLSYFIGIGSNPVCVHHRGASGIHDDHWNDLGLKESSADWQTEYAHVLYGALEGGPSKDGTFKDEVGSYTNTEVAIDYNAGITALFGGLIQDYGGKTVSDFPVIESPKWPEFSMKACVNQAGSSYTEVKVWAMNHTAWPARVVKDLSYNYYFDISELLKAGHSASDIQVKIGYDQHASDEGKVSISDPVQYKDNIYYVKLSFADGSVVMPTGQSEHRAECQFRIGVPDTFKDSWDASNDYSFEGLDGTDSSSMVVTDHITMYDGDTLIWGTEPDGKTVDKNYYPHLPERFSGTPKPDVTTTTAAPVTTTTTTTLSQTTKAPETTTKITTTSTATPTESTAPGTTSISETTSKTDISEEDIDGTATMWGDANVDNVRNISDVVLLNKAITGSVLITKQGKINCNLDRSSDIEKKSITSNDSTQVLKLIVGLISENDLPITK